MDIRTKLISAAERLFDRHGFTATGMDRLTREAGLSSRTVYKHVGSKTALIATVLSERDRRFMQCLDVPSVDGLFVALEDWVRVEGARGCLFLRAHGETGGDTPEIKAALTTHKSMFRERIAAILALDLGHAADEALIEQILVLFEGATSAAVYRGSSAVTAAREAAAILIEQARR
ncbi:TetR/AcrR family transcriptional regulator [Marinobacter nanhaiticus D15-8W]|uniref:TetR/AcrR family transcriptional regulator n=1 Tax=Marinobacter nanhaiticus D15-8W TaxID=626887 RepID=N6W6C8_9GAMM|nr:TetR/AcrR family transcriptional regulator [Marinobacter nanhaiticus]ENO15779.1 TetR/AcrR family transcriptional regulator [Marinobacter nanhaiticus D15-8W]BES73363.1 TetR/AcrR family transcriptional regulator [Marinobacter nanhaiticus D15-8W]